MWLYIWISPLHVYLYQSILTLFVIFASLWLNLTFIFYNMTTSHKHHFIFQLWLCFLQFHNVNLLYISQLQFFFFCRIGKYTMWIYLAVVIFVLRNCDCLTVLQYESHNETLNLATVFVSHNYDFVTHIATLYLKLWQSWFCFWQFCLTIDHNWDIVSQCDTVFWWKYHTLLIYAS